MTFDNEIFNNLFAVLGMVVLVTDQGVTQEVMDIIIWPTQVIIDLIQMNME